MTKNVPRARPDSYLLIGLWFAILTGLAEVALQAIRKIGLGRIIQLSPDLVWMAPLANIFFFAVPAFAFYVLDRWKPGSISLRSVLTVYSTLFFFNTINYGPLHYVAVLILSLGLGIQVARLATKYRKWFDRALRFTTNPLRLVHRRRPAEANSAADPSDLSRRDFLASSGIVMAGLFGGVQGWGVVGETSRLRSVPVISERRPNVLLIVLDTVRAANMGFLGYERSTTPRLDRLVSSAVCFDRAIATAPWTLPSHASMFTGRWHHELSADWRTPLDDTFPTLAEYLSAHGYITAGFVANTFFAGYEHGLNRGFVVYEDYPRTPSQVLASSSLGRTVGCWNRNGPGCNLRPFIGYYDLLGSKPAHKLRKSFIDWQKGQDGRSPFFAFLNFFDAHAPYTPPQRFANMFGDDARRKNPMHLQHDDDWEWTPDQVRAELDAYDATIAFIDEQLELLLETLERRGVLDNTVVIITSDHGEEFNEHGVMTHANSLYLPSVHVPLLVQYPDKMQSNTQVSTPVSLRNVPATVVDLVGLGQRSPFPGASLARYQEAEAPGDLPILSELTGVDHRPSSYPVSKGDMKAIVQGRYHYIKNGDGEEELYDIVADPWETANLVSAAETHDDLNSLRETMSSMLSKQGVGLAG